MSVRMVLGCFVLSTFTAVAYGEQFKSYEINVDGKSRTYHVHQADQVSEPLPVVLVLHGGGGNGKALKETYGFKPQVVARELIAVYPDAIKGSWLPEDVPFLDKVLDEVFAREKVNREQLFVTGASRGGLMTFLMVSKSKHDIKAAGTVIASHIQGLLDDFPLTKPVNFAMIAGTEDPLMPYNGGWGAMRKPRTSGDADAKVLPVEDVIDLLKKVNGITSSPTVSTLGNKDRADGCTNEVRTWTNPNTKRRVMLVKVIGGGHVVPGGRQYLGKNLIGAVCNDFSHTEVMWDFFMNASPTESNSTTKPMDQGVTDLEKSLRERAEALGLALVKGDIDKCIALSDPAVVKKTTRAKAERYFKSVHGLLKFTRVGPDQQRVGKITIAANKKSARVETEVKLRDKWQPPSVQIWSNVDGMWYFQETKK